jgi:hypothetical protein
VFTTFSAFLPPVGAQRILLAMGYDGLLNLSQTKHFCRLSHPSWLLPPNMGATHCAPTRTDKGISRLFKLMMFYAYQRFEKKY